LGDAVIEGLLQVASSAITGNGALDVKAIRLSDIKHGAKAQFQHQERMFDKEGANLGDVLVVFAHFDEQSFDIGALRKDGGVVLARFAWHPVQEQSSNQRGQKKRESVGRRDHAQSAS
jgi:small neutral amino acid transporter SnatA (MarC family)